MSFRWEIQWSYYTNVSLTRFVLFLRASLMNGIYTRWRVLIYVHAGLIISKSCLSVQKYIYMFEIEIVRFQRECNLI